MSGGPDLLCLGEAMLEFNGQPPGPDGRRLYLEAHGGDTSNVAVAAARQGARVGYVSAVGADAAGDGLLALWAAEGVDATHVRRDPRHPTGIYVVSHAPGGHEFTYHRAGSAASRLGPGDLPREAVASARMLFASGISQGISTEAADAVFEGIAVARAAGVRVAFDTNYRSRLWPAPRAAALIHAALASADVAFPGLEDAHALTGLRDPDAVLDFYLRLGPRLVVLKMGARGAAAATPERRWRVPPFPCRPVDATGAGDVFCGSFLARLLAGDGPEDAGRYAACAAALSTEAHGAVPPIPRAAAVRAALAAHANMDKPQRDP